MSGELDDLVAGVADYLSAKTSGDDTSNGGIGAGGVDADDSDGSTWSSDSDLRNCQQSNKEKNRYLSSVEL